MQPPACRMDADDEALPDVVQELPPADASLEAGTCTGGRQLCRHEGETQQGTRVSQDTNKKTLKAIFLFISYVLISRAMTWLIFALREVVGMATPM